MDQYPSAISVPSFTDAQQCGLASSGVLSRHESKPRRNEPTVGELMIVTGRGFKSTGRKRSDAGYSHESSGCVAVLNAALNLFREFLDPGFEELKVVS
jgi:hypothetical protein